MERDAQSCNQCWRPVSGTICKTSCNHLFCEVRIKTVYRSSTSGQSIYSSRV